MGLLQLGLDVEAIIGCAYPGFGFGGRNSVGLLVVNLYFYFFIGLRFLSVQSTMPCLHKASLVVRKRKQTPSFQKNHKL
jgi:hypothetical protein